MRVPSQCKAYAKASVLPQSFHEGSPLLLATPCAFAQDAIALSGFCCMKDKFMPPICDE